MKRLPDDSKSIIANGTLGLKIEAKHQGKGLGQDAVKLAIKEMRDLGAKDIVTSYHQENMRVKHIYEKLGFKDNGLEGGDPFLILPADNDGRNQAASTLGTKLEMPSERLYYGENEWREVCSTDRTKQ